MVGTLTERADTLSWGRYPRTRQATIRYHDRHATLPAIERSLLPYGNGRSYGDSCLNEGGALLHTRGLDRFIAFDPTTGMLHCEAGVWYGVWTPSSEYGYAVFDKANPLDPRFAPDGGSTYHNFGWIDSRWQVISLGIMSEEELRTGARRHVLVFDPETLTTSKLGLEAWRHVLREQGLEVRDGRLVYRPLFNLPFEGDIPKDLMIEGKSFKIHWNDSHRTVLMTSMVGDASRLILMIIDKATRESVMKEYRRTGTFQVRWPWAIWAATEHGRVPSAEEPFFMVRDWHVENLENGQSGEFTLEVQSDNRGIDMLDDVFLWGIGEELWAVDLREAVEKGTTKSQRVWKDPLVPAIQALFYAQDDDEPESNEKQQADMSSEEQEVQDGTEN